MKKKVSLAVPLHWDLATLDGLDSTLVNTILRLYRWWYMAATQNGRTVARVSDSFFLLPPSLSLSLSYEPKGTLDCC